MNRRSFLSMLSTGAIGAATLDVERLLWVPGQKTIFVPSATSAFLGVDSPIAWIAKEAADIFAAALVRPAWAPGDHQLSPRLSPIQEGPWKLDVPLHPMPTWKEVKVRICESDHGSGRLSSEILAPSAYVLADAFRSREHQTFGQLSAEINCEAAVATDFRKGVSIRARRWHDAFADRRYLAFDVIGRA